MKIIENVYFSTLISLRKRKSIIRKINSNKNIRYQMIILRQENENLMEIVHSKELYRLNQKEETIYLLGIFMNQEEAILWVGDLMSRMNKKYKKINKELLLAELEGDV